MPQARAEEQRRSTSSGGRLPHLQDQLGGRSTSRRGQPRDADGWQNVPNARSVSKAGDISKFGTLTAPNQANPTLAPSGIFAKRGPVASGKEAGSAQEIARGNSFAILENEQGNAAADRRQSREMGVDALAAALQGDVKPEKKDEGQTSAAQVDLIISNSKDEFMTFLDANEVALNFGRVPEEAKPGFLEKLIEAVSVRFKEDSIKALTNVIENIVKGNKMKREDVLAVMKPSVLELNDLALDTPNGECGFIFD